MTNICRKEKTTTEWLLCSLQIVEWSHGMDQNTSENHILSRCSQFPKYSEIWLYYYNIGISSP